MGIPSDYAPPGHVPATTENDSAESKPARVPAEYERSVDVSRHTTESVYGSRTSVQSETQTDEKLSGDFDNRVMTLVNGAIQEREKRENVRANHRNLNRAMTLLGAIVIGFLVVLGTQTGLIPKTLAPYAFVVTVGLDSLITLYAFIRHY